jgi:hypothetical protein
LCALFSIPACEITGIPIHSLLRKAQAGTPFYINISRLTVDPDSCGEIHFIVCTHDIKFERIPSSESKSGISIILHCGIDCCKFSFVYSAVTDIPGLSRSGRSVKAQTDVHVPEWEASHLTSLISSMIIDSIVTDLYHVTPFKKKCMSKLCL